MKIRKGFVSNSSSSSFIIITTEENFNNLIKNYDEDEKLFIENELIDKDEFLGVPIVSLGYLSINDKWPYEDELYAVYDNIYNDIVKSKIFYKRTLS